MCSPHNLPPVAAAFVVLLLCRPPPSSSSSAITGRHSIRGRRPSSAVERAHRRGSPASPTVGVTSAPPSLTPTSDHHAATADTCTTASSWAVASPAQRWPTTSTRPTASTSSYANRAIAWGGTSVPPRAEDDPPPQRASSEYGRPESYRTGLTALPDAIMDELGPARVQLRWKLINVDGRRDDNDDDGTTMASLGVTPPRSKRKTTTGRRCDGQSAPGLWS